MGCSKKHAALRSGRACGSKGESPSSVLSGWHGPDRSPDIDEGCQKEAQADVRDGKGSGSLLGLCLLLPDTGALRGSGILRF